jgi:hypothetical protein
LTKASFADAPRIGNQERSAVLTSALFQQFSQAAKGPFNLLALSLPRVLQCNLQRAASERREFFADEL